ncbi:hypothetical protein RclHR1_20620004 [Rhizophagus clarus]|uniref:Uncharacterized protein n=1 Tax=Rhizophagus clarus TaxID=94130 RepID=A0A2Z6QQY9_9GLOM|nr:hypothetical protein RclHR1_20620004 [Rhizophagus clarus]
MPRFNKPESHTILPISLLVLIPNGPYIASLLASSPNHSGSFQSHQPLANTPNVNTARHDHSKSSDRCDRSVSFSMALRTPPLSSSRNQSFTMPPQEAANILSLLKALQQDMAEVCDCITALEVNDRRMTRIEQHLGLFLPPDIPANNQPSDMLIDLPANTDPIISQVAPISASSTVAIPNSSSSSSTPNTISFSTQTCDKIQAINAKHSAIENKLDMLANSISGFIRSITSSFSFTNSASAAGSN